MFYFLRVAETHIPATINGATTTIPAGSLYICRNDNSHEVTRDTNMAARVGMKLSKQLVDYLRELHGASFTIPLADGSGTTTVAAADYPVSLTQVYSVNVDEPTVQSLFTLLADYPLWSDRFVIMP